MISITPVILLTPLHSVLYRSGQYIYNDVYMTLFNVIFTALTPIIIGIFDRDLDREAGYKYPQLYKQGGRDFGG